MSGSRSSLYEPHSFTGSEVYEHIRGQLCWGDPLSNALLDLPLERGPVFAYLPRGFRPNPPNQFKYGQAWIPGQAHEAEALTEQFIYNYLLAGTDRLALFQSAWYEADPAAAKLPTPFFTLDQPHKSQKLVCCFLSADSANPEAVENAMSSARSYLFVTALTVLPSNWKPLRHRQSVSSAEATALAANTCHLLIGAFNDLAWLIWTHPQYSK